MYLRTSAGVPATGVVPSGAELRISKSGDALVNGAGTWVERGSGAYFYECTVAECSTLSYLLLYVNVVGAERVVWVVDIDTRISAGETSALRRHIPIFLVDATNTPVTGLTLTGAEVQLSKAGGAFSNATGAIMETGDGVYDYEAVYLDVTDVGPFVLKVVDAAATPYLYAMDVVDENTFTPGVGGYMGAYLGGTGEFSNAGTGEPIPVPVPIVFGDPEYVDHVSVSVRRLPQQFKSGTIF